MEYSGKLKGFPNWLVERMLQNQEAQGNLRNHKVFDNSLKAGRYRNGFDWYATEEENKWWEDVLTTHNFYLALEQLADNRTEIENKIYEESIIHKDDFNGQLKGFPKSIVNRMLDYQEAHGNIRDIGIFIKNREANRAEGGFSWRHTLEGVCYWAAVINDTYFEKQVNLDDSQKDKKNPQNIKIGDVVTLKEGKSPKEGFIERSKYLLVSTLTEDEITTSLNAQVLIENVNKIHEIINETDLAFASTFYLECHTNENIRFNFKIDDILINKKGDIKKALIIDAINDVEHYFYSAGIKYSTHEYFPVRGLYKWYEETISELPNYLNGFEIHINPENGTVQRYKTDVDTFPTKKVIKSMNISWNVEIVEL